MRWLLYCLVFVLLFGVSGYLWMWSAVRDRLPDALHHVSQDGAFSSSAVLEIEGMPIKETEIDFEYRLIRSGLLSPVAEDMDPEDHDRPKEGVTSKEEPSLNLGENTARVLKESILASIVERKVLMEMVHQDRAFDLAQPELYTECVDQWIKTLDQAGPHLELFRHPENRIRLKNRLCEMDLLRQYLEKRVYAKITVEPAEVKKYFLENRDQFKKPATVTIRQIVLADEHHARRIRYKVTAHNFATMAAKHSITPEAGQGGVLGPFPMGYGMPRFYDVAFQLKRGQISNILKSTYGFHIIMLVKKTEGRMLSYEEAFAKVAQILQSKAKKQAYQDWVDDALHSIKVATPRVML
ncbi:MAG: peptidylprolyl isomerase [Zetaproteobacteria bacterium]|nr:peptidylprolyl isomerase [Zetaproteobacteria bacterium]